MPTRVVGCAHALSSQKSATHSLHLGPAFEGWPVHCVGLALIFLLVSRAPSGIQEEGSSGRAGPAQHRTKTPSQQALGPGLPVLRVVPQPGTCGSTEAGGTHVSPHVYGP